MKARDEMIRRLFFVVDDVRALRRRLFSAHRTQKVQRKWMSVFAGVSFNPKSVWTMYL